MKPSGQQQQHGQEPFYSLIPPPAYSLPGQEPPPVHQHQQQNINSPYQPTAPPPPPGLNAAISQQPQQHHHHHQQQQQQQQSPTPMIIYSNTVTQVQFGPYPMRYTCPNCNAHVMTETHSTPGLLTFILCFLTTSLLCCLVPFCIRECKDIVHRCPNCQYKLGLFKRI